MEECICVLFSLYEYLMHWLLLLFDCLMLIGCCLLGLWDIDPEDSAWYHLEQRDKNDPSKVHTIFHTDHHYQQHHIYHAYELRLGDANGLDLLQHSDLAKGQGDRDGRGQCAFRAQHQPLLASSCWSSQVLAVRLDLMDCFVVSMLLLLFYVFESKSSTLCDLFVILVFTFVHLLVRITHKRSIYILYAHLLIFLPFLFPTGILLWWAANSVDLPCAHSSSAVSSARPSSSSWSSANLSSTLSSTLSLSCTKCTDKWSVGCCVWERESQEMREDRLGDHSFVHGCVCIEICELASDMQKFLAVSSLSMLCLLMHFEAVLTHYFRIITSIYNH